MRKRTARTEIRVDDAVRCGPCMVALDVVVVLLQRAGSHLWFRRKGGFGVEKYTDPVAHFMPVIRTIRIHQCEGGSLANAGNGWRGRAIAGNASGRVTRGRHQSRELFFSVSEVVRCAPNQPPVSIYTCQPHGRMCGELTRDEW